MSSASQFQALNLVLLEISTLGSVTLSTAVWIVFNGDYKKKLRFLEFSV